MGSAPMRKASDERPLVPTTLDAGSAGGGTVMSGMPSLRLVLAVITAVLVLNTAPAYGWHGSGSITALVIDPKTPTTLYALTCDRGVFTSIDGGATWSATSLRRNSRSHALAE